MLETTEILKLLLTLCNEQKSGTLFLTTADTKACHIIEAMAFGSVKGIEVARLLPRLLIERTSFNSTLKMPLSGRASIEDQADIFAALGLRRQARSENVDSSSHSKTPRMYRGHLVVEKGQTDSTSDRVKSPSQPVDKQPSAKPKSKRIYRGQIIED